MIELDKHPGKALIEIQNCTSLPRHKREAADRKASLVSYQETAIPNESLRNIQIDFGNHGWEGHLSTNVLKQQNRAEESQILSKNPA